MSKTNLVTKLLSFSGNIMAKSYDMVETEQYELPLDFFLKCEFIAAQLEVTVDYLLDEFYDDGQLIVPSYVEE